MKVSGLLSAEFAKLAASKTILFSVIAALLVPVVYGGVLLSATWGPYDNLSNLPVAVVNDDNGAISNGQPINVGDELVKNLKEGNALGWKFVSSAQALKGMEKNDYYMVIQIPEDFSQRVTTVLDPDPKKLKIEYIQNEGLNFLASQVTKTATERIREQLANTITEQYTATVFSGLQDASGGIGKASEGSAKLADGTTQLREGTAKLNESVSGKKGDIAKLADGASRLKDGTGQLASTLATKQNDITKLADGTKQLKDGTGQLLEKLNGSASNVSRLADGSMQLHDGAVRLKDGTSQVLAGLQKAQAGSKELRDGVNERLVPGSRKVADGTGKLKAGSAKLAAGAEKLVAGLEQYRKVNPTVEVGPYYQQIVDGAKEISAGLDSMSVKFVALNEGAVKVADGAEENLAPGTAALYNGLSQLAAGQAKVHQGASKLETGAGQIADGNAKVNDGWNALISGVTRLDSGAAKISDGNAAVDDGWKKLSAGASKIDNGMGQVSSGTSSVNDGWKKLSAGTEKLNDGAGKVNDGSQKLSTGLQSGAEKMGGLSPHEKNIKMFSSPVELEGKKVNGYEHYRDSTAPYVLSLGIFVGILVLSLFMNFNKPPFASPISWFAVKFLTLGTLAILQAILMLIVAFVILGVQVSNPAALIMFTFVASLTFAAIVLFLASFGGNIGRFIALAFIVMQLSITGANLPVEMLPENLRALSGFLPFTYSIAGFRSVLTLNDLGGAFANMGILGVYLTAFALLSLAVFIVKSKAHHGDFKKREEVSQ
ncbi:YhgE/Pip domain-containing protein [Fictibacillus aquaticus]|uniref:YhgE/Pip domain-containing protein n=1 Tax=Fictibacillus aquaticus TaxID=2021314 RepID=UPI0035E6FD97